MDREGTPVNSTYIKSVVGGLRYLVHTWPDIAYVVGIWTLCYGLLYKQGHGDYMLSGFSDSDMAESMDDRKSTRGMAFYLDENLITWVSQKQRCVALSSCEAEHMEAIVAACQAIWLQRVLSYIMDV
ncbi:secreted RxLR effector protein 161-like [Apium graveolens]|uniref:secreted RxLR effector protein 161-like n=1 Tax=Apium graveolens TaxID=4045 RepID=UPI003D7A727C